MCARTGPRLSADRPAFLRGLPSQEDPDHLIRADFLLEIKPPCRKKRRAGRVHSPIPAKSSHLIELLNSSLPVHCCEPSRLGMRRVRTIVTHEGAPCAGHFVRDGARERSKGPESISSIETRTLRTGVSVASTVSDFLPREGQKQERGDVGSRAWFRPPPNLAGERESVADNLIGSVARLQPRRRRGSGPRSQRVIRD